MGIEYLQHYYGNLKMNDGISLDFLKDRLNKVNNKEESKDFITSFIFHYSLSPGKDRIETYIIRELYSKFLKTHSSLLPLSYIDFCRKLCKNIPTKRWGKQRFYLVDRSKLLLSADDELNLRINESIRKKEITTRKKKRG